MGERQLALGLTTLRKGNPAVAFSSCGHRLGGTWTCSLEEGRTWPECVLVLAPGSEMCANLSALGFRLYLTGCARGDASAHL